jgi:DNA-binding transcriptional LysR family regulator
MKDNPGRWNFFDERNSQISPVSDMAIFVAILEHEGFTAAARTLGLSPSALSKAVTRLEQRLGVRLLERTTRRLAPTPEGAAYADASRRILSDIDETEAALMEGRGHPQGRLRVNASIAFVVHQLAAALPDFCASYPDIRLDFSISDQIIDVVGEGVDVAIRAGAVGDERLGARRFAEIRRVICASPAYLARNGEPRTPQDLPRHSCVNVSSSPHLSLWPFRQGEVIETRGPHNVDNAEGVLALGLAGLGVIRLADLVVASAVRDGRLVPILTDFHYSEPAPLSLVFPALRQRLPRVRVFIDFVVDRFKSSPWRIDA